MAAVPPDLLDVLATHRAPSLAEPAPRRAAVAAILRGPPTELEILLMRRREHPRDPWSGHVSMPGGRHDPEDVDLLATAIRETHEEVGLALEPDHQLVCELMAVQARARGKIVPMDVTPFVFRHVRGEPRPGIEAEEVFWLPLDAVVSGRHDKPFEFRDESGPRELPGVEHDGRLAWGLTLHMIRMMLRAGGLPLEDLPRR